MKNRISGSLPSRGNPHGWGQKHTPKLPEGRKHPTIPEGLSEEECDCPEIDMDRKDAIGGSTDKDAVRKKAEELRNGGVNPPGQPDEP